jgi:hypothetical protein
MTYGRKLDLGYILFNSNKFVEAIKAVKPEVLVEVQKARENAETDNLF